MQPNHSKKTHHSLNWWTDIAFLSAFIGCLFFILLGDRPLFVPDEGRYAEIAREMVARHDWVTPYLNGIKYFEKPILFYWLGAIAIKIGGVHVWSLRCINALLGLMGCLMTYATARHFYDRMTGLLAALILATSSLYFVMSHMVSLDLPVTVFISATLFTFLLAFDANTPKATRYWLMMSAAAAAAAVLTKGLIGLVFPGMIVLSWVALTRKVSRLFQLPLLSALLVFFALAAPWHVLVNHRHPEFFYFYFIEQQFLRYTDESIGHYQPVWFFIPTLLAGFFPWVAFLPQTLTRAIKSFSQPQKKHRLDVFFFLWVVIIFIFFSFSKSKLIPYILPIFPALAILSARTLVQTYPKAKRSLAALVGSTAVLLLLVMSLFPQFDTRTVQPLTNRLIPILKPENDVITYNQYYQDLPFYLQRQVSILNWRNEMSYGMAHQDTRAWMINDETFWKRWNGKERVFVFISNDELTSLKAQRPSLSVYTLGETPTTSLISNRPN